MGDRTKKKEYCALHKCRTPNSKQRVWRTQSDDGDNLESKYCLNHSCRSLIKTTAESYSVCPAPAKHNEKFCKSHIQCSRNDCYAKRLPDRNPVGNPVKPGLCIDHTCSEADCDEEVVGSSVHCERHRGTCRFADPRQPPCDRSPVENGDFCANHTCQVERCVTVRAGNGVLCPWHLTCDIPGCRKSRHIPAPSSGRPGAPLFCNDHLGTTLQCRSDGCDRAIGSYRDNFCGEHRCREKACREERTNQFGYCNNHTCRTTPGCCMPLASAHTTSCILHKCKRCPEVSGRDNGLCDKHRCTFQHCELAQQVDGRCTQHREDLLTARSQLAALKKQQAEEAIAESERREREKEQEREAAAQRKLFRLEEEKHNLSEQIIRLNAELLDSQSEKEQLEHQLAREYQQREVDIQQAHEKEQEAKRKLAEEHNKKQEREIRDLKKALAEKEIAEKESRLGSLLLGRDLNALSGQTESQRPNQLRNQDGGVSGTQRDDVARMLTELNNLKDKVQGIENDQIRGSALNSSGPRSRSNPSNRDTGYASGSGGAASEVEDSLPSLNIRYVPRGGKRGY